MCDVHYVAWITVLEFHEISYCTRDFTDMYREQYGLSCPGIMWPLPSEPRFRSQGTRMAFSNIDGESVEGMKSN